VSGARAAAGGRRSSLGVHGSRNREMSKDQKDAQTREGEQKKKDKQTKRKEN
jgi:hypothetical protein